jgi:hypothetical protein
VAVGGAELVTAIRHLNVPMQNAVFIFDDQPRNKEIVSHVEGAINAGLNVCIWPESNDSDVKDINEMVKSGMTKSEVQSIIDTHTYSGLAAKLAFKNWKKI